MCFGVMMSLRQKAPGTEGVYFCDEAPVKSYQHPQETEKKSLTVLSLGLGPIVYPSVCVEETNKEEIFECLRILCDGAQFSRFANTTKQTQRMIENIVTWQPKKLDEDVEMGGS